MIKIFFAFNNLFRYDCSKCGAYCCHAGGKLLLSKQTKEIINKNYPEIAEKFVFEKDNKLVLKDVCWFLSKNNKCILENNYSKNKKPLSCQLFPYFVSQGPDNYLIVQMVPCPGLTRNKSRNKSDENNIEKIIIQNPLLIELTDKENYFPASSAFNAKQKISWDQRFQIENQIRKINSHKFKSISELINKYHNILNIQIKSNHKTTIKSNSNKEIIDLISFLVPQFRTRAKILKMNIIDSWDETLKFINKFCRIYIKLKHTQSAILNSWILSS